MKKHLKYFISGFKREACFIVKDINLIMVLLAAPLFYAFFYSTVYLNKVEQEIPVAVFDLDHSTYADKLIRKFDAHQMIKITEKITDFNEGKNEIYKGNVQGIVLIPKDFSSELKSGKGADIKIYLNTTRFLVSNDINKALNEVLAYSGFEVRMKYFMSKGFSIDQAEELIEPLRLDMRPLFNFNESYGDFLIPAVIVLIIQQTLLIGLSESIAKEREFSTIGQLFDLSGGNVIGAMNGKGAFYFVLYSAYSFFFFTVNFSVFKVSITGGLPVLMLLTIILIITVIYLSVFIASFFKRKIVALQFLSITSYPVFLISGYSWPADAMPFVIKAAAALLPSTPFFSAYQRIVFMGAGLWDVKSELIHMLILTAVYFTAAFFRMRALARKYNYFNQTIIIS